MSGSAVELRDGPVVAAVELRDVFCVHRTDQGDAASLQGLTLAVSAGEQICVLGPSGAGKTTLLRVIAGLQPPSAGTVRVLGRDVGRLSARARAGWRHRHVGFLHQHAEVALSPDLRIAEAVALPLALRGVGRRERGARALELLETAGLSDRRHALSGELSGGERQRVAVCAALAHSPTLLLADEPTAEVDALSAAGLSGLLRHLAATAGTTLIVVSHDAVVAAAAQRVVRIRDGRVVEDRGSLVVGAGGWMRLDPELLAAGGISRRARACPVPEGLLLTRASGGSESDRGSAGSPATEAAPAVLTADGPPRTRSSPARLRLEGISRARGQGAARRQVIEGLTLEFAPGALTLVVGRSGAGKTTLLELVGLLEAPSCGELVLDGQRLGILDPERRAALRRARVGYLPQEPVPVGFLSAAENIALALRIRGRPVAEASARAREALTAVGLDDLRRQRVARLSAGEAQRVALARALACARGLLVVDEPTSRLDEGNAVVVGQLLRRAAQDHGQTVICATHDPALVPLADAIVELAPDTAAPPGPQSSTVRSVNARP